ncbi:XdhC family protein [Pikeienuella sp. HZG-20]|uniref:XdhC family protein n=1 Tax=Paludibacillus litoralis TaxID=3133267 RepID=UPI0030EC2577
MIHDLDISLAEPTEAGPPIAPPVAPPIAMSVLEVLASPAEGSVLAVITGIVGSAYRPLGAMMRITPDHRRIGSLSSGCIEGDLALHADEARAAGKSKIIRYGPGSPYMDIQLPCGGGLDVLLIPNPDEDEIAKAVALLRAREPATLRFDLETGAIACGDDQPEARAGVDYDVAIQPEPKFYILGKGPEACAFSAFVRALGYPHLLLSPDAETVETCRAAGCDVSPLTSRGADLGWIAPDRFSAVVLFFHDHDWEPEILKTLLPTPAFYVGAQGSETTRANRVAALRALGVSERELARLKGPIGLVPSARDPRTLAVSVLAEILHEFPSRSEVH